MATYGSKLPRGVHVAPGTKQTRRKYGNKKLITDDGLFDSQREFDRWCELKLLLRAGEIYNLRRQVEYILLPGKVKDDGKIERGCSYTADFTYRDRAGREVVEDAKGFRTEVYIIKRKLMLHKYGITIHEV